MTPKIKSSGLTMKDVVHTIASLSLVIWLIGYLAYDSASTFNIWLLAAIAAAAIRIWAFKPKQIKKKP